MTMCQQGEEEVTPGVSEVNVEKFADNAKLTATVKVPPSPLPSVSHQRKVNIAEPLHLPNSDQVFLM